MKTTNVLILLGFAFGIYVCFALFAMEKSIASGWTVLYAAISLVFLICMGGLWRAKRWALKLSLVLAFATLGLAAYFVHFVWTFWIFQKPTLLDRILDELHPRVSLFWIFPGVWLFYFTRPKVREQFK